MHQVFKKQLVILNCLSSITSMLGTKSNFLNKVFKISVSLNKHMTHYPSLIYIILFIAKSFD